MSIILDGINVHTIPRDKANYVKNLGCNWARVDIDWSIIESTRGKYKWNYVDNTINGLTALGIKIYATIAYTPQWVNKDKYACPDLVNWQNFCKAVVSRYGNKISVYSLWNEPNLKQFGHMTIQQYMDIILKGGSQVIKSMGSYTIAAGDLSTMSKSKWTTWFSKIKKYRSYFDVFSMHCYHGGWYATVRRFKIGKIWLIGWIIPRWRPYKWYLSAINKPVWLTETGYKANITKSKEMDEQSDFYVGLIKHKKSIRVKKIFGYDLRDDINFPDERWGLYNENYSPKKVVSKLG